MRGEKLAGGRSYVHLCDFYATFCGLYVQSHICSDSSNKIGSVHSMRDNVLWTVLFAAVLALTRQIVQLQSWICLR
jgi:hypothetical protein